MKADTLRAVLEAREAKRECALVTDLESGAEVMLAQGQAESRKLPSGHRRLLSGPAKIIRQRPEPTPKMLDEFGPDPQPPTIDPSDNDVDSVDTGARHCADDQPLPCSGR